MRRSQALTAGLFILPFLIVLSVFNVIPIASTFLMSVLNFNSLRPLAELKYIGFQNYLDVFNDEDTMASFGRSLLFAGMEVPLMLAVALGLALLMNGAFHARGLLRTAVLVPYVCNITAVTIAWQTLLDPTSGPVNALLTSLGITELPRWLGDPALALPLAAVIYVYMNASYQAIVFLAALQEVPQELYESARLDGAQAWQVFWRITFPHISPATFFLVVASILGSFQTYNLIATLTHGGPGGSTEVAAYRIVQLAFTFGQFSVATAQSVLLFVGLMLLSILQFWVQRKWVHY